MLNKMYTFLHFTKKPLYNFKFNLLKSDLIASAVGIVHRSAAHQTALLHYIDAPLVPNLLSVSEAPNINSRRATGGEEDGVAKGEEEGEPGEHPDGEGLGGDRDVFLKIFRLRLVQKRVEAACQTVNRYPGADLALYYFTGLGELGVLLVVEPVATAVAHAVLFVGLELNANESAVALRRVVQVGVGVHVGEALRTKKARSIRIRSRENEW